MLLIVVTRTLQWLSSLFPPTQITHQSCFTNTSMHTIVVSGTTSMKFILGTHYALYCNYASQLNHISQNIPSKQHTQHTLSRVSFSCKTRYNSSWLCCVINTLSAEVTQPLESYINTIHNNWYCSWHHNCYTLLEAKQGQQVQSVTYAWKNGFVHCHIWRE